MSEITMPVAEVAVATVNDDTVAYELAFHVLPTVTEGEVSSVFGDIKTILETAGAVVISEEAPQRIELAYEIEKHLEGKNRKFKSAYFGWVRFQAKTAVIEEVLKKIDGHNAILRHLLIKLTRQEENKPFFYHEAMREAGSGVITVGEEEGESDGTIDTDGADTTKSNEETDGEEVGAETKNV